MVRIVTVVGARPQFIKCAAVSAALGRVAEEKIVHTGQHYDHNMSAAFFAELGIPAPAEHLGVGSAPHGRQTAEILLRLEPLLEREKPHALLVYGDTNSTLAGALAAAKLHIPVVHVEAGLRSFNRKMPEEVNRVLTDHVSSVLLCPTETAVANLQREGISKGVFLVGDVMYDSVMEHAERARQDSPILKHLGVAPQGYALATVHRAENTDDTSNFLQIVRALERIAKELPVILPLHPRTKSLASRIGVTFDRVQVVEPVGYLDMLALLADARLVLTDSGGVQKEAHWLGARCVTLREQTEWVETLEGGWNVLTGANEEAIVHAALKLEPNRPRHASNFERGAATQATVRHLLAAGELA